ncbi:MAG TPA: hypothetical protein VGZ29_16090 [Terriglobia bacterium]|nr:hypothetical protein [Terriglobia bacterium]
MSVHVSIVIAIVIVVAGLVAVFLAWNGKRKRSARLRARFGPEYDRLVAETGSRAEAEKVLEEREKRSRKIIIRPLPVQDREHFAQAWRNLQARFVDAPGEAVIEADQLLEQLMAQRGYPTGDFEQQADDISVDHPRVVQNYRAAHSIAERQLQGQASTEELREAVVEYRALYEELLSPGLTIAKNEVQK